MFQHTTARRRLQVEQERTIKAYEVSTHNRPKAAAAKADSGLAEAMVSTHNRPKAAAVYYAPNMEEVAVSTHNRPKAAAIQSL